MLVPLILMFVMLHFLLIRPQKKRQQELQKQIDSLQIGDGIVTTGGIHGIIANKTEHTHHRESGGQRENQDSTKPRWHACLSKERAPPPPLAKANAKES